MSWPWVRYAALPLILVLAACGVPHGERPSDERPSDAEDGRPLVLATFTVLADMARQVSCDQVRVESITKPGAEIHGYEFTPSDLKRAQGADLVLENGLGLDLWSRRFIDNLGPVPHVTLSEGVETLPIATPDQAGTHQTASQSSRTARANPHAWMSPRIALTYVSNIREALIRLDPAHAATYRRCAAAYGEQLGQLDRELAAQVARLPAAHRLLVTCEGAFSYLARDYGLEEAWLWPVNGERQVTPQRMESVIRTVRQRRVPAVFCESTVDNRSQQRVAAETGARFAGTFFVDSLSGPEGPAATYLQLMRHTISTLVAGLAGPSDPAASPP